jgi:hypothetical protein
MKCGRGSPVISYSPTRDLEVIDSELRLLLAIRRMVCEAEGRPPSTAHVYESLDERSAELRKVAGCCRCIGSAFLSDPSRTMDSWEECRRLHYMRATARHPADGKDARMTNTDLTLIAALLDRSGSMKRCMTATETGFDEMIAKHRSEPGEAVVTLSMFDDQYDNVYANVPIADVPPLTLVPRNMTAMLDAIGRFITEIGEHLAGQDEADRPGTVICLIMTDGYENASKEWSYDSVKALITQQRDQYNWSFLFLGANIDAVDVGDRIGVPKAMAMTYNSNDSAAVSTTYTRAAREMARRRSGLEMNFSDEDRRAASRDSKKN